MKIRSFALFLTVIALFALSSCGEAKEIVIDAEALSAEISAVFDGGEIELTDIDEETVDIQHGLKGLYSYVYCEVSVNVTSDEILILQAVDEESAEKAYKLLEEYQAERIKLFASYASEQVPKLEDALLDKAGKYVIFVVAEDTSEAEKIWNNYKG